jgi:tetratricopeptide (TPR) repeat protein
VRRCRYRRVMPRPHAVRTCLVALPLGYPELSMDGDNVFRHTELVAADAGFTCVRADFSEHGGFVQSSMLERLLIADLVIADLSVESSEVMYMIGVRQGVASRPTVLITAKAHPERESARVPTVVGTSDMMSYVVGDNGLVDTGRDGGFEEALTQRLRRAIDGDLPQGIPLLDATGWASGGRLEHDKTDVFLERIAVTSEVGKRIRSALEMGDHAASIKVLQELERELLESIEDIPDLASGLLGVYVGYRERAAYRHMVDLYPRMPPELRSTPVAREQLALALNRLAEASDHDDSEPSPDELRTAALDSLEALDSPVVTAETLAIQGRIYKGWFHAVAAAGDDAEAQKLLAKAIESYERAVKADLRDYFPGINAITLRLMRGTPKDLEAVAKLVPAVRLAVENAPRANSEEERYWQLATKLELACAAQDWDAAVAYVRSAVQLDVGDWMYETTISNLGMYRRVFGNDAEAVSRLEGLIDLLRR